MIGIYESTFFFFFFQHGNVYYEGDAVFFSLTNAVNGVTWHRIFYFLYLVIGLFIELDSITITNPHSFEIKLPSN